jgi:Zn-dependent peptidase ImmA (M78 family)
MHDMPNDHMETEANQFAADFLMPGRDVPPHLDRVTIERLASLKPYWRVSMVRLVTA